jgi:hypothetical protein
MAIEDTILHTVELTHAGFTVKVTQRYNQKHDFGHYCYVVTNLKGDIVSAGQTSGGPRAGKVEEKDLMAILFDACHWWSQEKVIFYMAQ